MGTGVKSPNKEPASHRAVLESGSHFNSRFLLMCNLREQVMAKVLGYPLPIWGTWAEFLAPSLGLTQAWCWLWAFGEINKPIEDLSLCLSNNENKIF